MSVLIIGEKERVMIIEAVARARRRPIPIADLKKYGFAPGEKGDLTLSDRKPGWVRPSSQHVAIPVGYHAAISFEEQPSGIAMHLSVSVDREDPRLLPGLPQVIAIAAAFGMDYQWAEDHGMVWLEEFAPGRKAVNVVTIPSMVKEGHA